jgi:hypothetical protein
VIIHNNTLGHRTLATERDDKGARKYDYSPINANLNMVDYVGCQGYHHLGLPQLSMRLGAISGNLQSKHHAYTLDYYSSHI